MAKPTPLIRRYALGGGVLVAVALGIGLGWWRSPGPRIDATDRQLVTSGKPLYEKHCASCHGADLQGEPDWRTRKPNGRFPAPPHDASGHTWHHSDAQLIEMTTKGPAAIVPGYESDMPGFGEILRDTEIIAILAYIKSTWPIAIRAKQKARNSD